MIELQGELKRVQSVADIATHQSQSLLLRYIIFVCLAALYIATLLYCVLSCVTLCYLVSPCVTLCHLVLPFVTLYHRRNQRDSELDEMRATLLEIEKQSDDKLTIGNTD